MIVIIDTREQIPYCFTNLCETETKKLDYGDYSLAGYEKQITIERKTHADIYGSLSSGRERFRRECEKLANYEYAAIVIEASLELLKFAPRGSGMSPVSVINTLLSWSIRYRLPVWLCGTRQDAELLTFRLLEKFLRIKNEQVKNTRTAKRKNSTKNKQ